MTEAVVPTPELLGDRPQPYGPLRLLATIANGRRSQVFAADSGEGTPLVAARVVHPDVDAEQFHRRIRLGGGLCLGAPPPKATLVDGDTCFYDPLVIGENLRTLRAICPPDGLPLATATGLVVAILDALIVDGRARLHGDLLPDHILVAFDGRIYLRDPVGTFAVPTDDQRLRYQAPETLEGAAASRRSDVYSVGVLLFELTTGQSPFSEPALALRASAPSEVDVPRPRDVGGDRYPLDLQLVVRRMLRPMANARFADVVEVKKALAPIAAALGPLGPSAMSHWIHGVASDRKSAWRSVLEAHPSAKILDAPRPATKPRRPPTDAEREVQQTNIAGVVQRRPIPEATTEPAGPPGFESEPDTHENLPQLFDFDPASAPPELEIGSEAPPGVRIVAGKPVEPAESTQLTTLDYIEEMGPLQPIEPMIPSELAPALTGTDPVITPGMAAAGVASETSDTFSPLASQFHAAAGWGSSEAETAMSDTIDESSVARLAGDDLEVINRAFEIVSAAPNAANDPQPAMAAPSLISEPPPLVPSAQSQIATHVVRDRVVSNARPIAIDVVKPGRSLQPWPPAVRETQSARGGRPIISPARISVREIREPASAAPRVSPAAPRRRRSRAWVAVLIAGGLVGALLTGVAIRMALRGQTTVPAPVRATSASEPDRQPLRPAAPAEPASPSSEATPPQ